MKSFQCILLVCLLDGAAALRFYAPKMVGRRAALHAGAAAVVPLFAAGQVPALTDSATHDVKAGA